MLQKLELPIADGGLLCKAGKVGDKGPRRTEVAKKYRILLEFGDQLGDFATITADLGGRNAVYEANAKWFGERWFQLPNAMYGSWLDALGKDASAREKYLRK
jgi:predicted secreted acid phosphatase